MRFQQAPYRIADVVALLFILHGNTSFGSLAPIIPYRSCKHYLEEVLIFPNRVIAAVCKVQLEPSLTTKTSHSIRGADMEIDVQGHLH